MDGRPNAKKKIIYAVACGGGTTTDGSDDAIAGANDTFSYLACGGAQSVGEVIESKRL